MKLIKHIAFVLLGVLCLINIALWPINKYEWMLRDDPTMILPIDGNASFYAMFAVLPIALFLIFIARAKTKKTKVVTALVISVLLGVWMYKFNASFF